MLASPTSTKWLATHVPEALHHEVLGLELWQWLGLPVALVLAVLLARAGEWLLLRGFRRLARATLARWDDALVEALQGPTRWSLAALALHGLGQPLVLEGTAQRLFQLAVTSLLILAVAALARRVVEVLTDAGSRGDDLSARSLRTHFEVTRRFVDAGIWLVAGAVFLMQFEVVRTVGVSLLASAGVVSVVIGLAAQKTIGQLFAGLQLSITQPIRLGDMVVVDGQFGTIEEIRLTFVVVRTWDLRRLVVPIGVFLDKTFENWSRANTALLGAVLLKVDFSVDVGALRAELDRVLDRADVHALWDGKTKVVSVTDSDDRTMTVRLLVGARDPSSAFDLRCLIREACLAFLAKTPGTLPRTRTEPWEAKPAQPGAA